MSAPVILYGYDTSPYARKIENILTLKKIPFQRVKVSYILPRPELKELLGVAYRRIPVLAIGNDIYCDTNIIVPTLERRFPPQQGYGTLHSTRKNSTSTDTGLIKLFSKFYADRGLFFDTVSLVSWEDLPEAFIKDRSEMFQPPTDSAQIVAGRLRAESAMNSHLSLFEEQLSDGRQWLLDTEAPSAADMSVHFLLAWGKTLPKTEDVFSKDRFPLTIAWVDRLSAYLQKLWVEPTPLSGLDAANVIINSTREPEGIVGFDEAEAARWNVKRGDKVGVAPDDYGIKHVTEGKLVALNAEECVLEIKGQQGISRCHFPRLGFTIKRIPVAKELQ